MSLEEIAARAGVTRMTLWRHFPGKEALVTAVVLADSEELRAELDRVLGAEIPPERRLAEAMMLVVERVRSSPWMVRILDEMNLAASWPSIDPDDRFLGSVRAFLLPHIRRMADERGLRSSPEHVLDWLLRQVFSFLTVPSARGPGLEVIAEDIERFVLPAVFEVEPARVRDGGRRGGENRVGGGRPTEDGRTVANTSRPRRER